MKTVSLMWNMVFHPRRTSQKILEEKGISSSFWLILGFGIVFAGSFLISYFAGDYPPPSADLQTWIDAWGEFAMLPIVKVPAESYRLVQAIFMLPLLFAIWILMAGSARMLSILFGGRVSFDQYANLLVFSFFPFWILATIFDAILSGLLGDFVLAALRMEYGGLVKTVISAFYPVMYTSLFGLGGVYNGIVTHQTERFSFWKVFLIGLVTFFWPNFLAAMLLR